MTGQALRAEMPRVIRTRHLVESGDVAEIDIVVSKSSEWPTLSIASEDGWVVMDFGGIVVAHKLVT